MKSATMSLYTFFLPFELLLLIDEILIELTYSSAKLGLLKYCTTNRFKQKLPWRFKVCSVRRFPIAEGRALSLLFLTFKTWKISWLYHKNQSICIMSQIQSNLIQVHVLPKLKTTSPVNWFDNINNYFSPTSLFLLLVCHYQIISFFLPIVDIGDQHHNTGFSISFGVDGLNIKVGRREKRVPLVYSKFMTEK